jgi:hypothetical protein
MMYNYLQKIFFMIRRPAAAGLIVLLIMLSFHISCKAGATEEIASLLNFVEQSACTFIRNGKLYDSLEARQHIEIKYNYYKKLITTAEEFIQYSATKSSITGRLYSVQCNGVSMNSSDWLNRELARLRTGKRKP